ncbi:hypothetical protein UPYG_G00288080 [Umbra pygmaea]|uniref:Tissue factor n=1 Tax=Umbra pygmaea TaxID=75934 RepID=A0ABD0W4B1_UMBPY
MILTRMDVRIFVQCGVLLSLLIFSIEASGEDYFSKAKDVQWVSTNFKTILTWGLEPVNFTYTVEYSEVGGDRQRNPHCIRSSTTECDLTNELRDLNKTYSAYILSEPLPGLTSDLVEFPYTRAKNFCPYKDTKLGGPSFKIVQSEDNTKMTLHIQDPVTALYTGDQLLTIRDIFKNDLKYKIIYNKAGSTGKREKISNLRNVELTGLEGESYCFMVAAYIPSRSARKLGEWSKPQCSPRDHKTIFDKFTVGAIAGATGLMLAILIIIITLTFVCCKFCCKKTKMVEEKHFQLSTI